MPTPIPEEQLLEALHWRYATKNFDATRKIPDPTWKTLEETLVLSPSSFGLQPYRFLVIKNAAVRERLFPHSWNQRQIVDASHLVVFAARTTFTEKEVDRFLDRIVEVRGVPRESLAAYRGMMAGSLLSPEAESRIPSWSAHQAYIALGNLLTSAALIGVDACPIEGFVPANYDAILGLEEHGYSSVVVAALGYRRADDKFATIRKVRLPHDHLVEIV
jgi:nitroreductase